MAQLATVCRCANEQTGAPRRPRSSKQDQANARRPRTDQFADQEGIRCNAVLPIRLNGSSQIRYRAKGVQDSPRGGAKPAWSRGHAPGGRAHDIDH